MSTILKKGVNSPLVRRFQLALLEFKPGVYSLGPAGADGDFGPATVTAVKQFQKDMGLTPTGVVDTATVDALALDPVTLESLIVMEPVDDTPAVSEAKIYKVIDDLAEAYVHERNVYWDALELVVEEFRDKLQGPSFDDTQSKALQTFAHSLGENFTKSSFKELVKKVPGLGDVVIGIYDAYQDAERAGQVALAAAQTMRLNDFTHFWKQAVAYQKALADPAALESRLLTALRDGSNLSEALGQMEQLTREHGKAANRLGSYRLEHTLNLAEAWIQAHFKTRPPFDPLNNDPAKHGHGFVDLIAATDSMGPNDIRWKLVSWTPRLPKFVPQFKEMLDPYSELQSQNSQRPNRGGRKSIFAKLRVHRRLLLGGPDTRFRDPPVFVGGVPIPNEQWWTHAAWIAPNGLVETWPTDPGAKAALTRFLGGSSTFTDAAGSLTT